MYILPLILVRRTLQILNVQSVADQRNTCLTVRLAVSRPADFRRYACLERSHSLFHPFSPNETSVFNFLSTTCACSAASETAHFFPNQ